uniref:Uncharacterized protein n=1 Tax=Strigamia maritima TaxID=126957 RepID=T1JFG1_STRMM
MGAPDSWSLSKFDLAAKLQACEIELQYTKEELERRKQEVSDCNTIIEKGEHQIKAQNRRQRQIENIHKELIHEYEQHVACLKQEVKEIKESHDKLLLKFKDLQHKQTSKTHDSSALLSARLIEATSNLEKLFQNSPTNFYGQSNTLEILQRIMNGHCIFLCDEILKRPLSESKIRILEENVVQFLWLVNETLQRVQEISKELKMLTYATKSNGLISKSCRDDDSSNRQHAPTNLDWNKILDSKVSIESILKEETNDMHDLENRIKSYLGVLEKLIEQKSKKQIMSTSLATQLGGAS